MSSYSRTAPDENRIGRRFLAPYIMIGLTLIGIADAILVAHANYTGQELWCPVIDGCNTVLNSPYSRVFGVPMSYFGFVYYLYMFGLAVRLAFEPLSRILLLDTTLKQIVFLRKQVFRSRSKRVGGSYGFVRGGSHR
jgi:uncharacterized membrane protein